MVYMALYLVSVNADYNEAQFSKAGVVEEAQCECDQAHLPVTPAGGLQPPTEVSQRASSPRGHSRASTVASAMSFYAPSTLGSSCDTLSRPSSQHQRQVSEPNPTEKRSNSAKTMLSKGGRILKRHGSKFSLSTASSSDNSPIDSTVPPFSFPRTSKRTRRCTLMATKRDILKRSISEPFAFQHITHTNRAHFENLGHVNRNELISEFSAIRAGQKAKSELRGIQANDIACTHVAAEPNSPAETAAVSPVRSNPPSLPLTPPKPLPPPKDAETSDLPKPAVRLSRSVENFSRPSGRSPVSPASPRRQTSHLPAWSPGSERSDRPVSATYTHCSPVRAMADGSDQSDMPDKPLPKLPTVHAVSTDDDTARLLRAGPLPMLPVDLADVPEEDESSNVEDTVVASDLMKQPLRHAQTLPNLNGVDMLDRAGLDPAPGRRSGNSPSVSECDNNSVPLMGSSAGSPPRTQALIATNAVQVCDWEDAIDLSWDQDDDVMMGSQGPACSATLWPSRRSRQSVHEQLTQPAVKKGSFAVPQQKRSSPHSLSEPVSAQGSVYGSHSSSSTLAMRRHESSAPVPARSGRDLSYLQGLGIKHSAHTPEAFSVPSLARDDLSQPTNQRRLSHHGSQKSTMSKSSSQESIILSIASSIVSGQRSSNSTASISDLTPSMTSIRETTLESQPQTPKDDVSGPWLDNVDGKLEIVAEPSPEQAERFAQSLEALIDSTYQKEPHRRAKSLAGNPASPSNSPAALGLPPPVSHSRQSSGSRTPVPVRTSSIAQPRPSSMRRQRSATSSIGLVASGPRSRASYSLFPGALATTMV